jgi:hypothetical protein
MVYHNVEVEKRIPKYKRSFQTNNDNDNDDNNNNHDNNNKKHVTFFDSKRKTNEDKRKERPFSIDRDSVEYEIVRRVERRRQISPYFDPTRKYVPRSARPEWIPVGLLGQIRIEQGQPTRSNWIKMEDLPDGVSLWFVR